MTGGLLLVSGAVSPALLLAVVAAVLLLLRHRHDASTPRT